MPKKVVWEFTNKRKLNAAEFVDYFERKVFRAIRKYEMLPRGVIKLEKTGLLNTNVLAVVLGKKFDVRLVAGGWNLCSDNMSDVAEDTFEKILAGKFDFKMPKNRPLYFLSDAEIELYARLKKISGKKRVRGEKVRKLFARFEGKNPDLEHNIINAVLGMK